MTELSNGDYLIDVSLTGGSGKASVTSPARVNISGGEITAEIEWSSPNYDYMEVDGIEYLPVNSGGNSRFIARIPELDADIPVKAETLAMSEPHMIDYTLRLNSSSARHIGGGDTAVSYALAGALIIIAAAVVFFGRRRAVKND